MSTTENIRTSVADSIRLMASPITGIVWVFAVVLTVLAGPFGTFEDMALLARTLYWVPVVTLSLFFGYVARGVVQVLIGHERPGLFDLAASVVLTLIFTPVLYVFSVSIEKIMDVMAPPFPWIILYVFAVAFAAYVSRRVVVRAEDRTYSFFEDEAASESAEPRLLRRLSPEIRGRIVRISGQDHHVEIATEHGAETLRLRLIDAISEMDTVEGYCSHRSHWVARSEIVRIERENSHKISLVLSNGDVVPVSRKYRPGLEEAGIL